MEKFSTDLSREEIIEKCMNEFFAFESMFFKKHSTSKLDFAYINGLITSDDVNFRIRLQQQCDKYGLQLLSIDCRHVCMCQQANAFIDKVTESKGGKVVLVENITEFPITTDTYNNINILVNGWKNSREGIIVYITMRPDSDVVNPLEAWNRFNGYGWFGDITDPNGPWIS